MAMPQHLMVRINVGGQVFHTSLHTVMEGARIGVPVFQDLCQRFLGAGRPWEQLVVPANAEQYGVKHFVDADPTAWPYWLEYLRSGTQFEVGQDSVVREVPFVEAGPVRDRIIRDTRRAGFTELAEGLVQALADRVEVEVGGELFVTTRDTLTKKAGYFRALMYGARGTNCSDRIFIDRDPAPFAHILSWMRTGSLPCSVRMDATLLDPVIQDARFYDVPELEQECLTALGSFSKFAVEGKMTLQIVISAVLKAVKVRQDNPDVLEKGCQALADLAVDTSSQAEIDQQGGIHIILEAMVAHPGHTGVQVQGCKFLGKVSHNASSAEKIVDAICKDMQAQVLDAGVQERCCRMVCNSGCKLHHVSTTKRDCMVTMIITAMATHKDNAGVQEQGCGACKALGCTKADLWTDSILGAMMTHKDHTGVQARASEVMMHLHLDAFLGKKILEGLMMQQDPLVFRIAVTVMCNIQIEYEVLPEMLVVMSDAIVKGMIMHQDKQVIQEQGCGALGNIWKRLVNSGSTWRGHESDVIRVILKSMGEHTQHEGIQTKSKEALATISDVFWEEKSSGSSGFTFGATPTPAFGAAGFGATPAPAFGASSGSSAFGGGSAFGGAAAAAPAFGGFNGSSANASAGFAFGAPNYVERDNCAAKVSNCTVEMMTRQPGNTKYWCQVLSYLCTNNQVRKHGGRTVVNGIISILKAHQGDIAIQGAGYQTLSTLLSTEYMSNGYIVKNPLYPEGYSKMEDLPAALPTSEAQKVIQEAMDSPEVMYKIYFEGKQLLQQLKSQEESLQRAWKDIQSCREHGKIFRRR